MAVLRLPRIKIADRWIGEAFPPFIVAEIGINHNGSLEIAKKMIEGAVAAGCHAVKFQKRTPELCVPKEQWHLKRQTPWGEMTYIDYRHRIELSAEDFEEIDRFCRQNGILWFASSWDIPSLEFIEQFDPPLHKAPSAMLTHSDLLLAMKKTGKPVMISTGMSTLDEIDEAVDLLDERNILLAHTTSSYPCPDSEVNLLMINSLKRRYPEAVIGYSGHEQGALPSIVAVALGAAFIERHITLDKLMWGTDQAASLDMQELAQLTEGIRRLQLFMGDGIKRVYESELAVKAKLRPPRTQRKKSLQTWYNQKIKPAGIHSLPEFISRQFSKAV
ncbi:MAG: N-acetylneuraminate synthase family protein [candidate division KSB1 bacterium]|nr:N-acetylneuraminate synthase family protein [candidate division KSB1 bacterium]